MYNQLLVRILPYLPNFFMGVLDSIVKRWGVQSYMRKKIEKRIEKLKKNRTGSGPFTNSYWHYVPNFWKDSIGENDYWFRPRWVIVLTLGGWIATYLTLGWSLLFDTIILTGTMWEHTFTQWINSFFGDRDGWFDIHDEPEWLCKLFYIKWFKKYRKKHKLGSEEVYLLNLIGIFILSIKHLVQLI